MACSVEMESDCTLIRKQVRLCSVGALRFLFKHGPGENISLSNYAIKAWSIKFWYIKYCQYLHMYLYNICIYIYIIMYAPYQSVHYLHQTGHQKVAKHFVSSPYFIVTKNLLPNFPRDPKKQIPTVSNWIELLQDHYPAQMGKPVSGWDPVRYSEFSAGCILSNQDSNIPVNVTKRRVKLVKLYTYIIPLYKFLKFHI